MQVKSENVFLVQAIEENNSIENFVVVSNDSIGAKKLFNMTFEKHQFAGITSLADYINTHKKIIASLNGDENAWPLIMDSVAN